MENPLNITIPLSGKTSLVHKKDHEGTIQIDPMTGWIITPMDERPDWAEGLVSAQMAERHMFYAAKLGDKYSDDMKTPEVLAAEDISWMHVTEYPEDAPYINPETGAEEPFELNVVDYDHEHRNEVLATVLGFERTEESATAPAGFDFGSETTSVDIPYPEQERTAEELAAFEQSQKDQVKAVGE